MLCCKECEAVGVVVMVLNLMWSCNIVKSSCWCKANVTKVETTYRIIVVLFSVTWSEMSEKIRKIFKHTNKKFEKN